MPTKKRNGERVIVIDSMACVLASQFDLPATPTDRERSLRFLAFAVVC